MSCDTKLPGYKKKVRSPTWNYFKRLSPALAKCNICKKKLSFKTSISNLKRHLLLKHKLNLLYKVPKESTLLDEENNVKKLLNLVEKHTCLWKYDIMKKHTSSDKKYEAWKQIASVLCPEVDIIVAVPMLSERFNALRDHFFEDKLNERMTPSVYEDDLQFLNFAHVPSTDLPESLPHEDVQQEQMEIYEINQVNIKNEPIDESYNVKVISNPLPTNQEESSSLIRDAVVEESLHWTGRNRLNTTNQLENVENNLKEERNPTQYSLQLNSADKDVLFLLSLTDDMRRVPRELKTKFKGELMVAISGLVKKYNQSNGGSY